VSRNSGFMTAGHLRLLAAKELGMKQVPVNFQHYDNEDLEYADLTADNALQEWSEIDMAMINAEIGNFDPSFDIDLLGIKGFTLDVFEKEFLEDEDSIPEVVEPTSKLGDIYQLGEHRVMCGDSTMIDNLDKLLNGNVVDLVFTDPPYNVSFNGRSGNFEVIKNDNLKTEDFECFIEDFCQTLMSVNPKNYYIWCNWKFYGILQKKLVYKACIVWAKNVFGLGIGYRHQHEFCLFNGKIDEHIKDESDVWFIKKDSKYVHPTQKPVELAERAINNHKDSKNILDFFGGSGSTLIACEKTNRICFMMELDPKYVDVIIKRWEDYTGKKAVLLNG